VLTKLGLLLLISIAILTIAYFLYWMPKPAQPRLAPSGQAAIRITRGEHELHSIVIGKMVDLGIIKKFLRDDKRNAIVWVTSNFYLLTFQDKEKAMIACAKYYWATVSTPRVFVIKDWRTKKTIGSFGPQGLRLNK